MAGTYSRKPAGKASAIPATVTDAGMTDEINAKTKRTVVPFYQANSDSQSSLDSRGSGQLLVLPTVEEESGMEEVENRDKNVNSRASLTRSKSTGEAIRSFANSSPSLVSIKFFQDPPHQPQPQSQSEQKPSLSSLTSLTSLTSVMTADTPVSLAKKETTGRVRNNSIKINRPRSQSISAIQSSGNRIGFPQILPKPPGMVYQPNYPFMVPQPSTQRAIFHPYQHPSIRPKPVEAGFINCNHLYASYNSEKKPLPRAQPNYPYVQLHRPFMVQNFRPLAPMPAKPVSSEPDSVLKLFSEAADIHEKQNLEKMRPHRTILPKEPTTTQL